MQLTHNGWSRRVGLAWCVAVCLALSGSAAGQQVGNRVGPVQLNATTCPPTSAAATGCALLGVGGLTRASFQIVNGDGGTWAAVVEGTIGGSAFKTLQVLPSDGTAAVTTISAEGLWSRDVGGYEQVRIRLTSYTSGTVLAYIQAAP